MSTRKPIKVRWSCIGCLAAGEFEVGARQSPEKLLGVLVLHREASPRCARNSIEIGASPEGGFSVQVKP